MGKRLRHWIIGLCMAMALPLAAVPAELPSFTALLVDETGMLDEASGEALLERLRGLQAGGRAQVAVLVARDARGLELSDFSLQVAQAWRLGRAGQDDGLLVVVLPRQVAARIEVGYGLEGAIPDLRASQWVEGHLLPALREGRTAEGLQRVLDEIEQALPRPDTSAMPPDHILELHPEWKLPFVIALFSVFALFPLFFGAWGAIASAPLYAAMWGFAAWLMWQSQPAAIAVGGLALLLPPLWNLNRRDERLPLALAIGRGIANAIAVLMMFGVLVLFISVGLWHIPEAAWGGPLFAGALALGLASLLFPRWSRPIGIVLRSYMHFLFALAFAYPAFMDIASEPTRLAFTFSGAFTALIALSLYLESREQVRRAAGEPVRRWSLWLIGLALLAMLPVGVLMLLQAALGADFETQLVRAAAGGGSIAAAVWWAARHGFFAALQIGLGGRFGGGGASGRG